MNRSEEFIFDEKKSTSVKESVLRNEVRSFDKLGFLKINLLRSFLLKKDNLNDKNFETEEEFFEKVLIQLINKNPEVEKINERAPKDSIKRFE